MNQRTNAGQLCYINTPNNWQTPQSFKTWTTMDLSTVSEECPNSGFEQQPESFYIELDQGLDNAS